MIKNILCCILLVTGIHNLSAQDITAIRQLIDNQQFDQALTQSREAKGIFLADRSYTDQMLDLGELLERLGELDAALEVRRQAFLQTKETFSEQSSMYIEHLLALAKSYSGTGNYFLASRLYKRAVELGLITYGNKSIEYANALSLEAELFLKSGNLAAAESGYNAAYNIAENAKNTSSKGRILARYAHFLTEFGVYTGAENYFRQALFIIDDNDESLVETYLHLSELYLKLNNTTQVDKNLEIAEKLLSQYPNNHPNHLLYKSIVLLTGVASKSEDRVNEVTDELLKSAHPDLFLSLRIDINVSLAQIYMGQFEIADVKLDSTLIQFRKLTNGKHYLIPEILDLQARIKSKTGDHLSAAELLTEAKTVRRDMLEYEHPAYLENLSNLSLSYWAMSNIKQSEKYFNKSLYLTKVQYQKQFAFLSGAEKELFYGNIRSYFNKFNNFVLENYSTSPSLIESSINNQLLFKGLLFNSTRNLKEKVLKDKRIYEKYQRYVSAKDKLNVAYKAIDKGIGNSINLDSLENIANYLEKEISLRVNLGSDQSDAERLYRTWENIRESLGRDEAALEIIRINPYSAQTGETNFDESKYMVLFFSRATQGRPRVLVIENGTELDGRNLLFYRNARKRGIDIQDNNSFDQYWKPIEEEFDLSRYKKIYVSPDGVYNLLSINTLYDQQKNDYILDKYQITLMGNLSDVVEAKSVNRDRVTDNHPLFVGYPEYNKSLIEGVLDLPVRENVSTDSTRSFYNSDGGINMLPGTLAEIESITSIFDDESFNFDKLTGFFAREDTLKFRTSTTISPRIVHVATHGFFLDQGGSDEQVTDPLSLSGILLSGAAFSDTENVLNSQISSFDDDKIFDDGILFAQEAMNLNLITTELVVLSACETGLGVVKNGEGVYGLQRAFQTAGANSVIMSLWKVDDAATNKFMTSFYRQWIRSGDKRTSFTNAQKAIRDEYIHPYYWGAFVMIGQ